MGYERVIKGSFEDINNLADLLKKLVESYRLLIGGAGELNTISTVKKSHLEEALKRADEVGELIDDVVGLLEKTGDGYFKYCKLKDEIITATIEKQAIQTEIESELLFKNN